MASMPRAATRRRWFQFTLTQTLIAMAALALVTWGCREIYRAIYPPLPSVEEWVIAQARDTNHQKREHLRRRAAEHPSATPGQQR